MPFGKSEQAHEEAVGVEARLVVNYDERFFCRCDEEVRIEVHGIVHISSPGFEFRTLGDAAESLQPPIDGCDHRRRPVWAEQRHEAVYPYSNVPSIGAGYRANSRKSAAKVVGRDFRHSDAGCALGRRDCCRCLVSGVMCHRVGTWCDAILQLTAQDPSAAILPNPSGRPHVPIGTPAA